MARPRRPYDLVQLDHDVRVAIIGLSPHRPSAHLFGTASQLDGLARAAAGLGAHPTVRATIRSAKDRAMQMGYHALQREQMARRMMLARRTQAGLPMPTKKRGWFR